MNILHLTTTTQGGAAKAACRLHWFMQKDGINSWMLVDNKKVADKNITQYPSNIICHLFKRAILKSTRRKIATDKNYYFYSLPKSHWPVNIAKLKKMIVIKPDAIILHWISYFLEPVDILRIYELFHVPIFWYMLDMAPLTGGCHYAWDCLGYQGQCGRCPALYSKEENDLSRQILKEKIQYFSRVKLTIVAASGWLDKQARASALGGELPINKILIGIDPDIFKPDSVKRVDGIFHIPPGKKVLFFGADFWCEKRKGLNYLVDSLKILKTLNTEEINRNIFLLVAGSGDDQIIKELPFPCAFYGQIKDEEILASAYRSAYLYLCPSIEDSGPMMINEAIMCGTPVVSFDMGVAADLVHNGSTGYRAKLKDCSDYAQGIKKILDLNNNEYAKMSRNCRELGLKFCHPRTQVDSFKNLIEEKVNS